MAFDSISSWDWHGKEARGSRLSKGTEHEYLASPLRCSE